MTTLTAPAAPAVTVDGQAVTVTFDRFDLASYALFLRTKTLPESEIAYAWGTDTYTVTAPAHFAPMLGVQDATVQRERLPLSKHLFDFQRWIVGMALDNQRFACWCDTGLGKSHIAAEWMRQVAHLTGGKVLILSPLQIIPQTQGIAQRYFDLDMPRLTTRGDLERWCKEPGSGIGIATHHLMIPGVMPEMRYLAGLAIDEADILKSGGGVIKWNMIKSARGIPYKLTLTATPAPNDTMEYASQAAFLEKLRSEGDILWTYFNRYTKGPHKGDWYVKPHAKEAFYKFMASWSVYMRNPAHFGFRDILATLPPPEIREYEVPITDIQRELAMTYRVQKGKGFWDDKLGVQERSKLSQLAKGFLYDNTGKRRLVTAVESLKPAFVADLVRQDVRDGRQVLVWTVFDEESAIILQELERDGLNVTAMRLDGKMGENERLEVLEAFRRGEINTLVSKAQLIGYGLNLQHCRSMVFSGFDDSFARMYQCVRRCLRYGQTDPVRVHIPYVPELEGMVWSNVRSKEGRFLTDVAIQEEHYRKVMQCPA